MRRNEKHRQLAVACLAVLAGCGGGSEDPCGPTDPSCPPIQPAVFELLLEAAPADIGALQVSVSSLTNKSVTPAGGLRIYPSAPLPSGAGVVNVILIAPSPGHAFARVTFPTPPGQEPTVVVTSAARNASGGYQLLMNSDVRVRVRAVTQ